MIASSRYQFRDAGVNRTNDLTFVCIASSFVSLECLQPPQLIKPSGSTLEGFLLKHKDLK